MIRRIALVGCVKGKRAGTHPARDLYTSPLFRKRRAYVERLGVPWWILSAKLGLVSPDREIERYDETLNEKGKAAREDWGASVVDALVAELGDLHDVVFEVHAGSRYVEAIRSGLMARGCEVNVPLAGRGLGQQLAWYCSHEVSAR